MPPPTMQPDPGLPPIAAATEPAAGLAGPAAYTTVLPGPSVASPIPAPSVPMPIYHTFNIYVNLQIKRTRELSHDECMFNLAIDEILGQAMAPFPI